ncbi:MAG: universal stress protein [Candidatus Amulumruptor caecigallinarius]|nr:universal stress protein [Candidatus Amulumruptor caecigallinarius]MCM1396032.1 universal stress protein [Candidatus Amulumruptor caecigallinarius]MCM1453031.1 universal stress protein [bacterium]
MEDRLITVAIHTYEKAVLLKSLLDSEGVTATLQNVNLTSPVVSSGVRVRIHESDLPLALRIIENSDLFCQPYERVNPTESRRQPTVLVPVDCSPHSIKAARVAFRLAASHGARVSLLNVFTTPVPTFTPGLSSSLNFVSDEDTSREVAEGDRLAELRMKDFTAGLAKMIARGEIPAVKYSVTVTEGIPEEVINAEARRMKPLFVVMGTRGTDRKERDMIGSVAAEVLDTCRSTVITIPAEAEPPMTDVTLSALYFGNMDQADMLALDSLYRIFNSVKLRVTLLAVPPKKNAPAPDSRAVKAILDYCRSHFPRFDFDEAEIDLSTLRDDITEALRDFRADLLAMPNKKRNVFARFFNPTLPHRLLYEADLPMVVIPV